MKKILFAISCLGGGGAERVVSVWASQLADAGYSVSLLLSRRAENEYSIDARVLVRSVAADYEEYKTFSFIKRFFIMRKILKEISPDIIISFLPQVQIWMMAVARGMKLRRIETVRNNPWETCKNNRINHFLWMLCYHRADATIFQTAEQAEYFSEKIRERGVVIPNPIASQYCENPKQNYSDSVVRFVAAGRIAEQKNYPVMIEAFGIAHRERPNLRLSIYGTGDKAYMDTIQRMIDERGLSSVITMHGRTNDTLSVLQQSDAFLMTSDYEGMPNALVEAMAVGLPCISTNCRTGPRDLIDHGENGFLVGTGDAEAIAEAVLCAASMDSEHAKQMGRKAREKVLDLCSESNSLKKLIKLIEE